MSLSTSSHSRRECNCSVCLRDNGGLDYCARCRFYDCDPEEPHCKREDDA